MRAPRILLVEDEGLIAVMMEDLLEEMGCEVTGSTRAVAEAVSWLEEGGEADAALLDVSLRDGWVYPVAEALTARSIPYVFVSGYGQSPDPRYAAAPLLAKPVGRERLKAALQALGLRI